MVCLVPGAEDLGEFGEIDNEDFLVQRSGYCKAEKMLIKEYVGLCDGHDFHSMRMKPFQPEINDGSISTVCFPVGFTKTKLRMKSIKSVGCDCSC